MPRFNPTFSKEELQTEAWKPVVGFELEYSISTLGRIRRDDPFHAIAGRILKPSPDRAGYLRASLRGRTPKRCRSVLVHIVMAETFFGPCPLGHNVNHKDAIKGNNRLENLEYCTVRENILHSIALGLQDNNPAGRNRLKTHCIHGHPFNGDNLILRTTQKGNVERKCRACRIEAMRRYQRNHPLYFRDKARLIRQRPEFHTDERIIERRIYHRDWERRQKLKV